jgi:hypothetical protein
MIPTPKQEFQRDKARLRTVEQMLESTELQAALLAAFNNFCWNLPPSENPQHGWNANCKRAGARAFLEELKGLVDVREPKKTQTQNLE